MYVLTLDQPRPFDPFVKNQPNLLLNQSSQAESLLNMWAIILQVVIGCTTQIYPSFLFYPTTFNLIWTFELQSDCILCD